MKRSSSPERPDSPGKKTKSSNENTEEQSGSASEPAINTEDTKVGENTEKPLPVDLDQDVLKRSDTPKRSETPSSTSELPVPSASTDNEPAATTSDTVPQENSVNAQEEDEPMEVKDVEKTDQKVAERWQLIPTTTRQRMNYLLTTSKLSDCVALVGKTAEVQQEFKLHSVILSMSSPEFEDILGESKEMIITDVEPDIFKQVLEYMYLDYVNLWSVEKTQALYRASVKFKLPHLCEKAVEYLMTKMNLDSIWPIYDAAIATQDQILTDECNKFFKKNINDLLKHPNFSSTNPSVIAKLVSDESLGVSEAELVKGILNWVRQKCVDLDLVPNLENKRSILLPDTICNLRFLALSKEYFVNNVAYSKSRGDESILTMEESYAILMNMVQPNSYPMPEGFCTANKQRSMVELTRLMRRVFNPLGTYQPITPQGPRLDKLTVLPGPALTAPFGCKSFSLDLIVNKNITLFGIQVPTFFPGMLLPAPKLYEETYIVSIQNASKPNKPMIGSINWSGKVSYNSFIDLLFKENVKLEANNTYTIMVYTNNTYYLNQKLCTVEEGNGVKFTLKDSVSLFGKPGKQDFAFISQLIYSA